MNKVPGYFEGGYQCLCSPLKKERTSVSPHRKIAIQFRQEEMESLIGCLKDGRVPLGKGNYGLVYRISISPPNRSVCSAPYPAPHSSSQDIALKEAKAVNSEYQEDAIKKLADEWGILNDLSHPNIVKVLGFYQKGKSAFLAMPCYLDTLDNALDNRTTEKKKHYTAHDFFSFCQDVARGFYYLVALRTILHCDLFPRNIFITDQKIAVIGDFGSAMPIGEIDNNADYSNLEGIYAPELVVNNETNSVLSESFSFGYVLRCVLGGRPSCRVWKQEKDKTVHTLIPVLVSELSPLNPLFGGNFKQEAVRQLFRLMTECLPLKKEDRCPPARWLEGTQAAMTALESQPEEDSFIACADEYQND